MPFFPRGPASTTVKPVLYGAMSGLSVSLELTSAARRLSPLLFLEALLPVEAGELDAAAPPLAGGGGGSGSSASGGGGAPPGGLRLALVDTVTVLSGVPRVWLYTDADGFVAQRRRWDRAALLAAWRQNGEAGQALWRR